MKLVSLELSNFCQHEHFSCRFSPGLNGIVGANGAGKSNILAAIKYAISGVTTYTIDDCVRIGSTGDSYVRLDFTDESGQQNYSIYRKLNMPRTVSLTTPDGIIRGHAKVSDFLLDEFGADFDILKSVQIVSQDEWVSLFKLPSAARATLLQRIFSCDFLKSKRENLRQFLLSINPEAGLSDTVKVYRELLAEKQYALSAYKDIASTEDVYIQLSDAKRNEESLRDKFNGATYFSELSDEVKRIDAYLAKVPEPEHDYSEECSNASNELLNARERIDEYKETLAHSMNCINFFDGIIDYYRKLDTLHTESSELFSQMVSGDIRNASEDVVASCNDRLRELSLSSIDCVCHVCGTKLDSESLETTKKHIMQQLADEKDKLDRRKTVFTRSHAIFKDSEAIDTEVRDLLSKCVRDGILTDQVARSLLPSYTCFNFGNEEFKEYDSSEGAIETITELRIKYTNEEKETFLALKELEESIPLLIESEKDFRSKYEEQMRITTHRNTAVNRRKELVEYLDKYPQFLNVDLKELQKEVNNASEEVKRLSEVRDSAVSRDGIVKDIESLQSKLESAESRMLIETELAERKQVLSGVVNLLSPDKFPRAVVLGWLKILESSINTYLEAFNAEYVARVQNDTDIYCEFPTKVVPSWALSGGQQVVLAIAWRLALHNTFARSESCGFLTLDEPTTFLDKDNIDNLVTVMSDIKTIADSNNLQIIVITHAQSLSPLFDNVIKL